MNRWSGSLALLLLFSVGESLGEEPSDLQLGQLPTALAKLLGANEAREPILNEPLSLTADEIDGLMGAAIGEPIELPNLAAQVAGEREVLSFRRVTPYGPGARIRHIGAGGTQSLDPTDRRFFLATNDATGVALIVDPRNGDLTGFLNRDGVSHELHGPLAGLIEVRLVQDAKTEDREFNQCLTEVGQQPHDPLALINSGIPISQRVATRGAPMFQTEVAVDTDNEWLADKFGNNTVNAQAWIEDIFMFMNVFYERDVSLNLLISDTTLRTTPDPFTETDVNEFLNEFSEFWRVNQGAVQRDFAMLFSGRSISPGSFSGIAWLDLYCNEGFQFPPNNTAGSYSVNRIGSARSAAGTAQFVGHELGHNLGSPHTHCYSPELDMCFNQEAGCFNGSVSCPIPEGNGTIMSYCHFPVGAGGANCGTSREEFHPEVINLFDARIAANFPACISNFAGANESPVAAGESFVMDEDTSLYIGPSGVLRNDTDAEGDPLSAVQDAALTGLSLNPDGSFTYTPAANLNGQVSFSYHANDTNTDSNTVTVTIRIIDVVEPPEFVFNGSFEGDTPP